MAYLLVDIGNTFVKWGRYPPDGARGVPAAEICSSYGRVLHDELSSLTMMWKDQPRPDVIVISNVAGTRLRNPLLRAIEVWPDAPEPHWISSQAEQCGVTNGYLNPRQLGSDRWAAMIGARALVGDRAALVAVCGTATTIDLLSADGEFVGGAIMPGLGLMQRVLHEQTAALPDSQGEYVDYPRQTVDAIASGCAHAQAGAVERLYYQHKRHYPDLVCIISGGAARTLGPRLTIDFRYHENLVLEGLYRIAQSLDGE
ncbi:MAG: type III pantothenate kinase [Burkholderiaceae bacterium]